MDFAIAVVGRRARAKVLCLAVALMSVAVILRPAPAYAKEELDPMAKLRRTDAEIRAAVNRRVPDWSPEAEVRRKQIERLLGGLLDYEEIARVALGSTFSGLAPDRRRAFLTTFAALTRQTFVARLASQKTKTSYDTQTITGGEARVTATACGLGSLPEVRARIEYRLALKGSEWMVTDVLVDGTSLVASYQRQFRKLIAREGMDGLMQRMRIQLASARPDDMK
jgi:phospholipid transport system substrate-binding protein